MIEKARHQRRLRNMQSREIWRENSMMYECDENTDSPELN